MLAGLAVDPLAGLVDSAYMGRAGAVQVRVQATVTAGRKPHTNPLLRLQLAAVGIALSVLSSATKLLNTPLLAVTTSQVATALGEQQRCGRHERLHSM
jgi:hypothetical protein